MACDAADPIVQKGNDRSSPPGENATPLGEESPAFVEGGRGTGFAAPTRVRFLRVRFHPGSKTQQSSVVVAFLACDRAKIVVHLQDFETHRVRPFDPLALRAKLEFLVRHAQPQPYERLQRLKSQFWSFEPVEPKLALGAAQKPHETPKSSGPG